MSLVELLVAFAISSVILAGLTYMMVTSLKLYGRTNANVDAQNEAQTALNLVVDSVMSAKGVCMAETDPARVASYPDEIVCALFGDLKIHDDNTMEFIQYEKLSLTDWDSLASRLTGNAFGVRNVWARYLHK